MQPALINLICPRCQLPHAELEFTPFTLPFIIGPFTRTHWALCPKTGEPIIVNVLNNKDAIRNVAWRADDFGDYWIADLMHDGKPAGRVGTYYELGPSHMRAHKQVQELEMLERFEIES